MEGHAAVAAGNLYDKYGTANPAARRLVRGFRVALEGQLELARPTSLLDVGCGEGVLTAAMADRMRGGRVVGVDLRGRALEGEWRANARPNLEYRVGDAARLPATDGQFDATAALEVLEHLPDPGAALREMRRVGRRWLIASVPREPLWRMANLARGAYPAALGNTPGHRHHWSAGRFASVLEGYGEIVALRSPFPWTIALVRLRSESR